MTDRWSPLAVMQFTVAIICLLAVVAILFLSFWVVLPESNQRVVDVILGAMLTVGFANIIGFLYGQKEQAEQAVRLAQAAGTGPQDVRVINAPQDAVPVEPTDKP
jgi:hypothetical protein